MPKLSANGIKIHYWQSGKGPDVVLSHGLGGNLAGWHLNMVPELQSEYRVTTYDLRGHGRSDQPDSGYTYRNMVEDLKGLLDSLGIEQADLVGHSQGGDISLQFALVYPERVRKLVVIEAGLLGPLADYYRRKDWEGWPYVIRTMEKLLGAPIPPEHQRDLEYYLQAVVDIPIMYGPSRGRRRDEKVVKNVMEFLRPMWKGYRSEKELTVENLSEIGHSTLLLYEKSSIFFNSFEVLSDRLPNCQPVLLKDGNLKHFTVLENPVELLRETRAFLASKTMDDEKVAREA